MKNIILIGFMGTGKTEVGRCLAKRLKMAYADTDDMIEKEQKKSINDIFGSLGEPAFREMESRLLDKIEGLKGSVISTGGGIILRPENVKKLKDLGPLVLLWASPEVVYERLKNKGDRPLLKGPDPMKKIREILDIRTPIYKSIADFEVDTSRLSPDEACNKIEAYLKKAGQK